MNYELDPQFKAQLLRIREERFSPILDSVPPRNESLEDIDPLSLARHIFYRLEQAADPNTTYIPTPSRNVSDEGQQDQFLFVQEVTENENGKTIHAILVDHTNSFDASHANIVHAKFHNGNNVFSVHVSRVKPNGEEISDFFSSEDPTTMKPDTAHALRNFSIYVERFTNRRGGPREI